MPVPFLTMMPVSHDTSNKKQLNRDTLVEFFATTLFVYGGTLGAISTGTRLVGQGDVPEDVARILPIAMSFGVSILALAYSIGHMSGGHMNPGVSLLMMFRGEISIVKMLFYWLAQFAGATLASVLVWGSTSEVSGLTKIDGSEVSRTPFLLGATTLNPAISPGNGFLLEFMGSCIFYFVIAQTALDKRGVATTGFPAIPIGLILVVVHICLIPFTGCGVNPARTFGPAIVVCLSGDNCSDVIGDWWWIYWVGPFLASFCVAVVTSSLSMDVDGNDETTDQGNEKGVKEEDAVDDEA